MRKLNTGDLFAFSRMVRKIGLKDKIKEVTMQADSVKDIAANGFDMIYTLFEVATEKQAEKEIYKFLSSPFECTEKEVEEMPIAQLFEQIKEVADIDTLKLFFKQALS